jgi:hypothetical protein
MGEGLKQTFAKPSVLLEIVSILTWVLIRRRTCDIL